MNLAKCLTRSMDVDLLHWSSAWQVTDFTSRRNWVRESRIDLLGK
jgi:hypothetical protein